MSRSNQEIWEDRIERGGNYFTRHPFLSIFIVLVVMGGIGLGARLIMAPINFAHEAATVAHQEFNPAAMLKKYEWFKNTAAALTAKTHDIEVLKASIADLQKMPRSEMDRFDKQELAQGKAELAGLVMSYNELAGRYNAQIAKFNWKPFVTSLPVGAEQVLSQEFAPYKDGV